MKFVKLSHSGVIPTRATKASAGYDLVSPSYYVLSPGERVTIPTGIGWTDIPDFIVGIIKDRSGLAHKKGITVLAGVIDADYDKKDIGVILLNTGRKEVEIDKGDRIAQLVMTQIITMGDVPESVRAAGFGSTGS